LNIETRFHALQLQPTTFSKNLKSPVTPISAATSMPMIEAAKSNTRKEITVIRKSTNKSSIFNFLQSDLKQSFDFFLFQQHNLDFGFLAIDLQQSFIKGFKLGIQEPHKKIKKKNLLTMKKKIWSFWKENWNFEEQVFGEKLKLLKEERDENQTWSVVCVCCFFSYNFLLFFFFVSMMNLDLGC